MKQTKMVFMTLAWSILLNRHTGHVSFCLYLEKHRPNHSLCFSFLKDGFALLSLQWLHKLANLACVKERIFFVAMLQNCIWKT